MRLKIGTTDLEHQYHFGFNLLDCGKCEVLRRITCQGFELEFPFYTELGGHSQMSSNMMTADLDFKSYFALGYLILANLSLPALLLIIRQGLELNLHFRTICVS